MLDKPEFDCNNLGSFYDCGCAEDEEDKEGQDGHSATTRADAQGVSDAHDHLVVEISKEELVSL